MNNKLRSANNNVPKMMDGLTEATRQKMYDTEIPEHT
jgi:hypothetical protein